MSPRVHNFSAGPGVLPLEVLEAAAAKLINHTPFGMSIMEMSHRSKGWVERQASITETIRRVLAVPDTFEVLFLTGGATTQFAMVPLNLLPAGQSADYLITGTWSVKALQEARKVGLQAREASSSAHSGFDHIPSPETLDLDDKAVYAHYTSNNTVSGTQYKAAPETGDVPLVCDASSDIMSRPIDFARHDLVYAGAQKNMGPAGVTMVFVRKSVLDRVPDQVPTLMAYKTHAAKNSAHNTPPVWPIHMVGLVAEWVERHGGVGAMAERAQAKAAAVYGVIDEDDFYQGATAVDSRSLMNVTFRLPTPELDSAFVSEAALENLVNLKGHRSVGGCRASLYNALPEASVQALVEFMRRFRDRRG